MAVSRVGAGAVLGWVGTLGSPWVEIDFPLDHAEPLPLNTGALGQLQQRDREHQHDRGRRDGEHSRPPLDGSRPAAP